MASSIANCSRCGKLCVPALNGLCVACIKEIDKMYEQCLSYLREHQGSTITELSEATEVSVRQITKFIREGRISLYKAPNLSYPCEICGILIREGAMCDNCRQRLNKEIGNVGEELKKAASDLEAKHRNIYNIHDKK